MLTSTVRRALVVSVALSWGCAQGGSSGFPDTGFGDTVNDVVRDTATDASPVDASHTCASNADCASNPAGMVCDTATGRCVGCLAMPDTCPPAQHCDPTMDLCLTGCHSDDGCMSAGDGGALTHCDTTTHTCVQCTANSECPTGTVCTDDRCQSGCDPDSPCLSPLSCCGGACVDTRVSPTNCGVCGTACASGVACMGGTCGCPSGMTVCSGACVDESIDDSNCGTCAHACSSGQTCTAGVCGCASGLTVCGSACVDTSSDAANCGSCGNACASGTSCMGGTCACAVGLTLCRSTCTDTSTDSANCGACGNACASGETCDHGTCTASGTGCTVFVTSQSCPSPGSLDIFTGTTGSAGGHFVYACVSGTFSIEDFNCNTTSSVGGLGGGSVCSTNQMLITHIPCDGSPSCSTTYAYTPCP